MKANPTSTGKWNSMIVGSLNTAKQIRSPSLAGL